jgi:hypothetical protein
VAHRRNDPVGKSIFPPDAANETTDLTVSHHSIV